MATRAQVQRLLDGGHDYSAVAERLGIAPGEAYLLATGRPADGSDSRWFDHPPQQPPRPQMLVGPAPVDPTRHPEVEAWVRERARRELSR